jgi:hypothetical protein
LARAFLQGAPEGGAALDDTPRYTFDDWFAHQWITYVGDRQTLLSEKLPDAVRHVAIRSVFSGLMFNHPQIVRAANRPSRRALDKAEAAFLEKTGRVTQDDAGIDDATKSVEFERFWAEYGRWIPRLFRSLRLGLQAIKTPRLPGGLMWPWLFQDLASAYGRGYLNDMVGRETTLFYVVDPAQRERRTIEVEVLPGETERDALARHRKALKSTPRKGRMPRKKIEDGTLQRYAEWFYRNHVLGEPVDSLAREYHDTEPDHQGRLAGKPFGRLPDGSGCDDRKTVEYGIAQAEKYLKTFPTHRGPGREN